MLNFPHVCCWLKPLHAGVFTHSAYLDLLSGLITRPVRAGQHTSFWLFGDVSKPPVAPLYFNLSNQPETLKTTCQIEHWFWTTLHNPGLWSMTMFLGVHCQCFFSWLLHPCIANTTWVRSNGENKIGRVDWVIKGIFYHNKWGKQFKYVEVTVKSCQILFKLLK